MIGERRSGKLVVATRRKLIGRDCRVLHGTRMPHDLLCTAPRPHDEACPLDYNHSRTNSHCLFTPLNSSYLLFVSFHSAFSL